MTNEQIKDELVELDAQLASLAYTVELLSNHINDGVDDQWQVIGTVYTLKDIAHSYYLKFNKLHGEIDDVLDGKIKKEV